MGMSAGDLAWYAVGAGLDDRAAATAVAIVYPESGGNPKTRYVTAREDSRGLWQINVKAHPQYASQDLYNPGVNARAMYAISGGGKNWKPWSGYTSGAYRLYLPEATLAVKGVHAAIAKDEAAARARGQAPKAGESIADKAKRLAGILIPGFGASDEELTPPGLDDLPGVSDLGKVAGSLAQVVLYPAAIAAWLKDQHNLIRVAQVIVGGAMVLVGLAVVAKPVTAPVAKIAKKAVTKGMA